MLRRNTGVGAMGVVGVLACYYSSLRKFVEGIVDKYKNRMLQYISLQADIRV